MSDNQIRVGIIGAGQYALRYQWPVLKEDSRVDVIAICRRNEKLLAKAAAVTGITRTYTDWREMIEKEHLDAVLVCTPNHLHAEPTIAALDRGLHVLVEKPMTLSVADANAMTAAANASKGNLMIAYNRRCDPLWRAARGVIRDGVIGKIRQISTVTFSDLLSFYDLSKTSKAARNLVENSGQMRPFLEEVMREGNWRSDPVAAGGGMFVDMHTHTIDLMLWLAGSPPREVSCLLTRDGLPVERAITTHANLENGVLFSLSFTNGVDADQEKNFGLTRTTVAGDSGVLLATEGPLGSDSGETKVEIISDGKRRQIVSEEETSGTAATFVNLIANGGENPAPPEECAWAVALTQASYLSAEERRIVTLG